MRMTLLLTASFFLLHVTFAGSFTPTSILYQTTNLNFIAFPQSSIVPGNAVKKKITLKERIVLKFFKKKNNIDPNKNNEVKSLSLFSKILIGLGALFILITLISNKEALLNLAFAGGILIIIGIILGIFALIMRKKLQRNER